MSQHYLDEKRADEPHYLPCLWVTSFGPFTDKPEYPEPDASEGNDDEYNDARRLWTDAARECPCRHEDGGDLDDHGAGCAGWYACVCIPGCLPDSSWAGPYKTEDVAVKGGRALFGEDSD